jgi:hypothetical protein
MSHLGFPTNPPAADPDAIGGMKGMVADPSTLASTGLLAAVLFAVVAGFLHVMEDAADMQGRLLALTGTIDSGDVALVGIAVALLLVTPDPPGGIPRSLLLQFSAVLAGIMTVFELIRTVVVATGDGTTIAKLSDVLATFGVAAAAATVAFYAAKESFLKERAEEARDALIA